MFIVPIFYSTTHKLQITIPTTIGSWHIYGHNEHPFVWTNIVVKHHQKVKQNASNKNIYKSTQMYNTSITFW